MKEMIIVEGRKHFFTKGEERKAITAKKAEAIFAEWKAEGLTVSRKYGMGGKVCWVWVIR